MAREGLMDDCGYNFDVDEDSYNSGFKDGFLMAIDEFAEKLKAVCNSIIEEERNHHARPISWAVAYEDFKDDIDDIVVQLKE